MFNTEQERGTGEEWKKSYLKKRKDGMEKRKHGTYGKRGKVKIYSAGREDYRYDV